MRPDKLKTTLIILSSVAAGLLVITAVVVFYPAGSYQPVVEQNNGTTFSNFPTSTATSTIGASTSTTSTTITAITTITTNVPGVFAANYTAPYPVTWKEDNEQFSLLGASLQSDQLTLTLAIQMGSVVECVPVNVRLIADESGTQKTPDSPAGGSFTFPDTQSCTGTPGATYSEQLVFTVTGVPSPYLFTTGGASNTFFNVATDTAGNLDVTLPGTSG